MAVTENMLIDLQVKTNNAEKQIEKISDQIEKLSDNSNVSQEQLALLQMQFSKLSPALKILSSDMTRAANIMSGSFVPVNTSINTCSKDIAMLSNNVKKATVDLEIYNMAGKTGTSIFSRFGDAINYATGNIQGMIIGVTNIINLFQFFINARNVKLMADMLALFSALAAAKGMFGLANQLRDASIRLEDFSVNMEQLREKSTKTFNEMVSKAKTFNANMELFGGFAKFAEWAGVLYGAGKVLYKYSETYRKHADEILVATSSIGQSIKTSGKIIGRNISAWGIVEAASLAAPALLVLGSAMQEADSSIVRMTGTIVKWIGVLSTGLVGIIGVVTAWVGNLAESIGQKLVNSVAASTEKFIKFQSVMTQFNYTVQGFAKTFGVDAVGSLEYWSKTMETIYKSTIFTREEIAKSVKLLIAEGQVIGLTVDENTKLLQRASDVAAATGRDLYEVSQMIVSGLTNNADAVLALGIDIRNTSLSHSEYAKNAGIAIEQMDAQQLSMARLSALYEKTIPIIGAAANQTKTMAGATAIYEKILSDIQIKLGETGTLTEAYYIALIKLARFFAELPSPLLSLIGNLKDFLGVLLIITGKLIKISVAAFAFVTVLKLVNYGLTSIWGISISLSSIFGVIFKRILPLVAVFLTLKTAIEELSETSLSFNDTIKDVARSLYLYTDQVNNAAEETSMLGEVWSKTTKVSVGVAKLAILGLVQTINYLGAGILRLRKIFSSSQEETQYFDYSIIELEGRVAEITRTINKTHKEMGIFTNSTALAAEKVNYTSKSMEDGSNLAEKFREKVIQLAKKLNEDFDISIEKQRALGNEFQKAIADYKQAQNEMEAVFKRKSSAQELAQKYADAEKKSLQASLEIERLRLDTIKKITEQQKTLQTDILRAQGKNISALKFERDEAIKAIEEQIAGLKLIGDAREDDIKKLEETRKLLLKSTDLKILDERNKFTQKAIDAEKLLSDIKKDSAKAEGNVLDEIRARIQARSEEIAKMQQALKSSNDYGAKAKKALDMAKQALLDMLPASLLKMQKEKITELANANSELMDSINEKTMTQAELTEYRFQKEQQLLSKKIEEIYQSGILLQIEGSRREEILRQLELTDELLRKQKDLEESKQPSKQYQQLEKAGTDVAANIGNIFKTGTMGMVGGAMSIVGAVVDAISSLLDFIPDFINKIAGIFDKLTNFGDVLLNAFKNLNRSLSNFTRNFIPNIMQAIPDIVETIVDYFAEEFPSAMESLLDQLPNVIDKFIDRIPDIVEKLVVSIIDNAPRMVWMFVQAFIKLIPKLMVAWMRVVGAVVQGIVNGIVNGIKKLGDFFKGISIKGPDTKKMVDDLKLSMKAATKTLTGEASKIFAVMDLNAAATTTDIIQDIKDNIYEGAKKGVDYLTMWWHKLLKILNDVWDGIVGIWRGLWSFVQVLWDGIINTLKGVWQAVEALWAIVIEALTNLWNALQSIWNVAIEALSSVWDTIAKTGSQLLEGLKGIWEHVLTTLQTLWDGLRGIWDGVIAALTTIIDIIKSVWDGLIKSFSSFWESLKDIGTKIWDGLVKGIKDNGNLFSGIGTKIWEGLKSGLGNIYKTISDQIAKLDPSNLFEKMFKIDYKGKGTVEKTLNIDIPFANFAKGGLVPGNALVGGDSKLNDRVLALLSPGEAIIPRSLMENNGIKSIVDGVLSGRLSPERYWGGSIKVGGTTIGISDKGVSIGDQTVIPSPVEVVKDILTPLGGLWDVVRKQAFDMVMKMFEANKFHSGGLVPSFALGGQVPAMLNPGEFVINRNATRGLGLGYLNSLNTGNQMMQPNITINIEIETTKPIDDTFFRNTLMPRIKEDIKRRTLNGEFVISSKGIRS